MKSGNGLYTQFLLTELKKPESRIEDVFKRVRFQVRQSSKGRQIPWESTSLEDDFFFNTGRVMAAPRPDDRAREQAFTREKADWDKISASRNPDDFYAFLQKYPSGNMGELAQAHVERLDSTRILGQADRTGEVQNPSAPRFRLGDTYEYQTKDGLTGLLKSQRTAMVILAMGTTVFTSDLYQANQNDIFTSAGALSRDGSIQIDPPVQLIPGAEYVVGKKWQGRSKQLLRGRSTWLDYQGHVVARENVTTPAGTFPTYKVVVEISYESGQRTKSTYWMQPDWGFPIKRQHEVRERFGGYEITVDEMLSRKGRG